MRSGPYWTLSLALALATFGGLAGCATAGTSGNPWAWGSNAYGQLGNGWTHDRWEPVPVHNLTGVVAMAAGDGVLIGGRLCNGALSNNPRQVR